MKKALLASVLSCLAVVSARADLIWYEPFDYPDGPTTNVSAGVWAIHSTSGANDSYVRNHRLEISGNSSTNAPRQADVNRKLCTSSCSYTSTPTVLYASFTINCTNLPTTVSNYIAHFFVSSSTFHGKLFSMIGSLPGTWRLGVSGAANAVNKIYPVDLAPNTDYQVVVQWDPVALYAATLWVNPLSSGDLSVVSGDAVTTPAAAVGYAFRQASGATSFFAAITNLAVATTFDEAATNVWSLAPVAPVVVYQPQNTTNSAGNPATLSVVAAGQGLANLTYQWQKNSADITNPDGNSNVLAFASLAAGDAGPYRVVVSNPSSGLSVTSAVAYLAVNIQPTPPTITQQPTNTTVYFGQTATLRVAATGQPTITYAWYYNGSPATGGNVSGADTDALTIVNVQTNNGTTGTYRCDVTNPNGTTRSSNAVLSALGPQVVTIGYLRTLVDPVFYLPTNTTALFTVSNAIVTTHGGLTGAANGEFFIQDGTGGIAVFVAGGGATMPSAGDRVNVTGPLGQFNSLLQMNLSTADPSHSVTTNSQNNPLPAGIVLPFSFTNGVGFGGVSNAIRLYEGPLVTFTNVFFPAGFAGTNTFQGNTTTTMTNQNGETFRLFLNAAMTNIIGLPIPPFAWTVTGPMGFFLGNAVADRSGGFEIDPTSYADIVTNAPPPATGVITLTGSNPVVSWAAQPYMSYSILRATEVAGPYVPLVTGLTFNTTAGQYTDTNTVPATRFYRIISP